MSVAIRGIPSRTAIMDDCRSIAAQTLTSRDVGVIARVMQMALAVSVVPQGTSTVSGGFLFDPFVISGYGCCVRTIDGKVLLMIVTIVHWNYLFAFRIIESR